MSVIIVILLTAILVLFLHIFEGRQWVNPLAILGLSLSFIILCLENNSLWGDYSSMIYMTQFAKVLQEPRLYLPFWYFLSIKVN